MAERVKIRMVNTKTDKVKFFSEMFADSKFAKNEGWVREDVKETAPLGKKAIEFPHGPITENNRILNAGYTEVPEAPKVKKTRAKRTPKK